MPFLTDNVESISSENLEYHIKEEYFCAVATTIKFTIVNYFFITFVNLLYANQEFPI